MSDTSDQVLLRDIHKRFGETVALKGCSLTIRPGEVHAIVGENGSGKSTLAKILSGVVLPDSGKISIFGQSPKHPIAARKLGVATIFQEVLVADPLSVAENIFVGADSLWSQGKSQAEKKAISRELLQRFTGEDIDPEMLVRTLPLSIRQWIVIARALVSDPRLLILDESSAALDLDATARLHTEIRKLRDRGCCVVIVTHRIAELIRITDHATVLRDGAVIGELAGEEITEANLLGLMSPNRGVLDAPVQAMAPAEQRAFGPRLLSVSGLSVVDAAPAFDFELRAGQIVGVTGLDGQGQGDFLRIASGLKPAAAGRVEIEGAGAGRRVVGLRDAVDGGMAFISGDRAREGIFPNLSIFENFSVPLYRSRSGKLGWIDRAALALDFAAEVARLSVKMGAWSNRITSLSGGNQQKVLIGRALAAKPRILVLDDPARGVDVGTKRELYAELKAFAAEGGAVIYLSSEIEEFFDFADRVLVFRGGGLFRTIPSERIAEHSLLAAMFGHEESEGLSFDLEDAS